MPELVNIVLSHQSPAQVDRLAKYWSSLVGNQQVLIAYGGSRESFDAIQFQQKLFIEDGNLRTRDHQREGQSYTAVFKDVSSRLQANSSGAEFVTLFEFDHLPLVEDLNRRQIERMNAEHADVVAYHLRRVDGTSHAHFLYYAANSQFASFVRNFSVRSDPNVVFSMFGTGSCWRREAFDTVAEFEEPFPIYFELYLPTLAHHLGFRIRDYGDQDAFISNLGDRSGEIKSAQDSGAWTLHPVKNLPDGVLSAKKS